METVITDLHGEQRQGQVFITWPEPLEIPGITFNVYQSTRPIQSVCAEGVLPLAHHIEPHSARDWWQDPASFSHSADAIQLGGFCIHEDQSALSPSGGLFVHTITNDDQGIPQYYAVTPTFPDGKECTECIRGGNTLMTPITAQNILPQPIPQNAAIRFMAGAGAGKCLVLNLHWRGGGMTAGPGSEYHPVNHLFFGDRTMGWREGLAFKFNVRMSDQAVWIEPNDRAWTGGRAVIESKDEARRDHCSAVNTWWYGYHSNIYDSIRTAAPLIPNYTEEYLLYLLRWAREELGVDVGRTYVVGASMGGSGALSLCMHHPEEFAAAVAHVGVVTYNEPGHSTAVRLENVCGPLDDTTQTPAGIPLLNYMDGAWMAAHSTVDLPYFYMTHGRQDASFPWKNKPPFYRAMQAAHQGLTVYWNDGDHDMHKQTPTDFFPADLDGWVDYLQRFSKTQSYPVFTACSEDRDPGNGNSADGDITGWLNRGFDWSVRIDAPDRYVIDIAVNYPGIHYPVQTDVTFRRLQQLRVAPGDRFLCSVGQAPPREQVADPFGLLTIPHVALSDENPVQIAIQRRT